MTESDVLAFVLRKRGADHYDEALRHYNRAIEIEAELAEAHMYRGGLYTAMNRPDRALQDHARLLELGESALADELKWVIQNGACHHQIDGADLRLFRLSSNPLLAPLKIATTAPSINDPVVMIGAGRSPVSNTPTLWYVDVDANPWVWDTSLFNDADGTLSGYEINQRTFALTVSPH